MITFSIYFVFVLLKKEEYICVDMNSDLRGCSFMFRHADPAAFSWMLEIIFV